MLNTFLLSVQSQINAQPRVPIQQLYEIERGKLQTQSDCTLPDYNAKNSSLKRIRYGNGGNIKKANSSQNISLRD